MSETNPVENSQTISIAALAGLFGAVATAADPPSILAVTMEFLKRWHPQVARIVALQSDGSTRLRSGRLLAEWRSGQIIAPGTDSADFHPVAEFPLIASAQGHLATPVFFTDLVHDLRLDEPLQEKMRAAGYHAAVLVPLYIESYGGWQGMLKVFWNEPRAFTAEEQDFYRVFMTMLAAHLGVRNAQQRLGYAQADLELLQQTSKQLNLAQSLEEVIRVITLPAPARDETEVTLCSIETDADGKPGWLTVNSVWNAANRPPASQIGARFYLPDIPFSSLYLSSPDAPLLIGDVTTDPRVDEYARRLYAASNVRATIVMALTLQGRWIGLVNICWPRPIPLGPREEWLYHELAMHMALRLDNSLILERLRASLEATRQQGTVLNTILNNIPVGIIYTEVPSGQLLLSNAAAVRLIGHELAPDQKLTYEEYVQSHPLMRPGSEEKFPFEELPSRRAIQTGKSATAELDVIMPDKGRASLELIGVPMHDKDGNVKNIVTVISDIGARKRAEEERRRLQDEALRAQAAALAERSSPLIPITDDILVLPIIGSIDTERGQQVMDTVLNGTSQSRARVAIIDITGVRTVDTQAASVLTNAAQALRLLGVEPVLTGIRSEVAQTMVGLGVRMDGIITHSTLQAGIQYALRRIGKSLRG